MKPGRGIGPCPGQGKNWGARSQRDSNAFILFVRMFDTVSLGLESRLKYHEGLDKIRFNGSKFVYHSTVSLSFQIEFNAS
jgi:hypothetical protein